MQDKSESSQNLSRRLSRLDTDMSMDGKGNKNSLIMAHNEIGEQLWVRTAEGSGKYQVSALPSNGTATIKLPINRYIQDSTHNEMAQGRSGKFVAIRIGDAEVKCLLQCWLDSVLRVMMFISGILVHPVFVAVVHQSTS